MDTKCFYPGCINFSPLICFCTSRGTTLCHMHIPNHDSKYPNSLHNYISNIKTLNSKNKEKITGFINTKLSELTIELENINNMTYQIISTAQKISKHFFIRNKAIVNIYKKLLKEIDKSNLENMLFIKNKEDPKHISINDIEFEVKKSFLQDRASKFGFFDELACRLIDECKEFESYLNKSNSATIDNDVKNNNSCLYMFQKNTKTLIKYDLDTFEKKLCIISLDLSQGHNSVICYLPNNKLFVSGGYITQVTPATYMIDLYSKNAEKLQNGRARSHACGIYYKNKVLIFGGNNGRDDLNGCDAYDLRTRLWHQLVPLPRTACYTSLLSLRIGILISGRDNFMFTYDLDSNTFREVINTIPITTQSILIKDNEIIHLLHGNLVYLTSEEDIKNWHQVAVQGGFSFTTCMPKIKGRYAYFTDHSCKLYQYDLDTFNIIELN